jgi:hypothetical protein
MEQKLKDLYYSTESGLKGFNAFWKDVKRVYPSIERINAKDWYDSQEMSQIMKKPVLKKDMMMKITARYPSYQIDVMELPKELKQLNKGYYQYLVCIEITSRKAYIYPIKTKGQHDVMEAYKQFLTEIKQKPFKVAADAGFKFNAFTEYNDKHGIQMDLQTAKDDHVSQGNRLGIIDAFTRTIKRKILRYMHVNNTNKYIEDLPKLLDNYNNTIHSRINDTPNNIDKDPKKIESIRTEAVEHNNAIREKRDIKLNDTVRAIEIPKSRFKKEGQGFSTELYTIAEQVGNKYKIKDSDGNVKPKLYKLHELLKPSGWKRDPKRKEKALASLTSRKWLKPETPDKPTQADFPVVIREVQNRVTEAQMLKSQLKVDEELNREGIQQKNVVRKPRERKPSQRAIENAQMS